MHRRAVGFVQVRNAEAGVQTSAVSEYDG
jgi:hypothetical protein